MELKLLGEDRTSHDLLRVMEYRDGSDGYARLLPAWKSGRPLPLVVEPWWKPISEVYARIGLRKLRQIDSDADEQAAFTRNYLTPTPGTIGLPILGLLLEPGDKIVDSDVDYLAVLARPPGCLPAASPLLYDFHFSSSGVAVPHAESDPEKYLAFTKRFLEVATASNREQVMMTIPSNLPFSKIDRLLEMYADVDSPMVILDAFGKTLRENYPQVQRAVGFGTKGTHSLREKRGERFALYAFDTKASTGRGKTVPAQRLVQLAGGYSSFGPLHTNRTMVTKPRRGPLTPPRVLVPDEIAMSRVSVPGAAKSLMAWCVANAPDSSHAVKAALGERERHHLHSSVQVAKEMGDWALDGTAGRRLDGKKAIKAELGAVRRNNRRMLSVQKTLI